MRRGADLPGPECSCNAVRNGPCCFVKFLIQQGIVLIVIDEADLNQNGRNVALAEYYQIGAFVDSQIFISDLFQLPVDIGGYGPGWKPCVVDQAFHSTVLIRIRTGITVYGDKNIGSGCVAFGGLLVRGFIDVLCPCVFYIEAVALQNIAYGESERQGIIFFTSSVIYGTCYLLVRKLFGSDYSVTL